MNKFELMRLHDRVLYNALIYSTLKKVVYFVAPQAEECLTGLLSRADVKNIKSELQQANGIKL